MSCIGVGSCFCRGEARTSKADNAPAGQEVTLTFLVLLVAFSDLFRQLRVGIVHNVPDIVVSAVACSVLCRSRSASVQPMPRALHQLAGRTRTATASQVGGQAGA